MIAVLAFAGFVVFAVAGFALVAFLLRPKNS